MKQHNLAISVLSFAIIIASFPATTAEPIVDIALGAPLSSDFNGDEGGWTANPPAPPMRPLAVSSWAWGTPTSGPGVAASGSKVWATNLSGNYLARDCSALLSPPIAIPAGSTASVSFKQWRHMEEGTTTTSSAFDAGMLFVTSDGGMTYSLLTPAGGYTSKNVGLTARQCLDNAPTGAKGFSGPAGTAVPPSNYSSITTDLSAFAGQTVQYAIAFGADSSVHRAGWYIDDFAVTIDATTTVEDFEASDGGFTIAAMLQPVAPQGFSWDTPTAGPTADSAGWSTNPSGNYGHMECAWVESPAFPLGDVADPGLGVLQATLTWDQFFRANSLYSAGIVQIGVHTDEGVTYHQVTPLGGYPGKIDGTYASQLTGCLGVEAGSPSFEGTIDTEGSAMRAYQADISAFAGSEVSVRFFFSSAWSNLNPTLYSGWSIDNVNVDLALFVDGPDADAIVDEVVSATEDPAAPGWTTGGHDSTWEYGVATYGPVGETVFGTNLTGRHDGDECSWAETPAVPGAALLAVPTLTFEHFYDIYPSSTAGAAWNGVALFVSTDGGANWSYVDVPEYDLEARYSGMRGCLNSIDPTLATTGTVYDRVFSGNHSEWETVSVDLSEFADSPTVKVRFVFSSGISILRDGYNLRTASLGGVKIL